MRFGKIFLASVVTILSLTIFAQRAKPSEGLIISQSNLDALVLEYPMFSGSVVVAQDGEITASVYAGYEDRESGKLNNAQTSFSVASVGKMFTAVAIAQLVEAHKLTYETPVLDVIAELGDQISNEITVDHLLHHTSGLDRITGVDDATLDAIRHNADYFALVLSSGIGSEGPAEFAYRNENFQILGEIIERISGQSYESYIRNQIADPAGMSGPVFLRRDIVGTRPIAENYLAVDFETWWNSEEPIVAGSADEFIHTAPPATPSAGGGSYATALDMIRFATALRNGTLVSPASFNSMCGLTASESALGRGYGRGCSIDAGERGTRVGHTGSSAGIQARFFLYLERGVDVVVLSNHDEQAAPLFNEIDDLVRTD